MERNMGHEMSAESREADLVDMLRVLRRNARRIGAVTAISAVVALVVCLVFPKSYRSETRLYPPQDRVEGLAAQMMGQAGGLVALAAGAGASLKTPGDLYVAIVKSRTVLDRIVDRFDLLKLYGKKFRQDARKKLLARLTIREDRKSGIIVLAVDDRDPKRAADMANAFAEELKALKSGLAVSEAGQRKAFFDGQLVRAKEALTDAEENIKTFQQRTGLFQVDAQARAIIEGIARLRAGIAAKEIEIGVLRSFATERNPDLQRAEEEARAMRIELSKLETRKGSGFDPIMSSGRVPEIGVEYLRRLRELKYNEVLFELLSKQYELAKLEEAKGSLVIQVIDRAVPPERKHSPKTALIVLLAAGAAFFLCVLYVLLLEYHGGRLAGPRQEGAAPAGNPAG